MPRQKHGVHEPDRVVVGLYPAAEADRSLSIAGPERAGVAVHPAQRGGAAGGMRHGAGAAAALASRPLPGRSRDQQRDDQRSHDWKPATTHADHCISPSHAMPARDVELSDSTRLSQPWQRFKTGEEMAETLRECAAAGFGSVDVVL